ncbi:MAG: hypothetical protein TU36_004415 [Vulcanisaeta sp. AZ3]
MVVSLVERSTRGIRRFLKSVGLSVGKCFDERELISLLKGINSRYSDYWLLGWREHRVSDDLTSFVLTIIDPDNDEYMVRINMGVSVVSISVPMRSLNLDDDLTGITVMMSGSTAYITGRILCVRNVRIRKLP